MVSSYSFIDKVTKFFSAKQRINKIDHENYSTKKTIASVHVFTGIARKRDVPHIRILFKDEGLQ